MNNITIMGFLGADPQTNVVANGKKVVNLRVATNKTVKGNVEVTWWSVAIWGDKYDRMLPSFKKGSPIIVQGELQTPTIYISKSQEQKVALKVTANHISFNPFQDERKKNDTVSNFIATPANPTFSPKPSQPQVSQPTLHPIHNSQPSQPQYEDECPF